MLAYVFFHRPAAGVDARTYEEGLTAFHRTLDLPSAAFRLDSLPFGDHGPGYEDWYLVSTWSELGRIGEMALGEVRRGEHDAVAAMAGDGWGGVWALKRGPAEPPSGLRWVTKPAGEPYERFVDGLAGVAVWQRQLVLGPAPEFAVSVAASDTRQRLV